MANLYYYLGPIPWRAADNPDPSVLTPQGSFVQPKGTVGMIDLRTPVQCATPGASNGPVFFASDRDWGGSMVPMGRGDIRELRPTIQEIGAWEAATGYRPSGDTLARLIFDHLTNGADPLGLSQCNPHRPVLAGELRTWLSGHGDQPIFRSRFRWGRHDHANKVKAAVREDMRYYHQQLSAIHFRKVLGAMCRRHRLRFEDWHEVVPNDLHEHVEGPLDPETSVSDNFPGGDGELGATNWTEHSGDWEVVSNECHQLTGFAPQRGASFDTVLSSADHFVQADVVADPQVAAAPVARMDGSTVGGYYAELKNNQFRSSAKTVAGARTQIDNGGANAVGFPHTMKISVDGDQISYYDNAGLVSTDTDGTITTGTQVGVGGSNTILQLDDWSAEDLAAPAFGGVSNILGGGIIV